MYKLVAMDFDGTLLDDNKKVSKKNIDALNKLRQSGYLIVASTARNFNSVSSVVDISLFDFLSINNGATLYDVKNDKFHKFATIDFSTVENIVSYFEDITKDIIIVTDLNYYHLFSDKESNVSFIKNINNVSDVVGEIVRINISLDNNIIDYNNFINSNFSNINSFIMQDSKQNSKWIVVNPYNINKKIGLEKLGNIVNVDLKEMIFFGDGLNDIEAISNVGIGVAMENALTEVKNNAKYITTSNNNDGIYNFFEKLYER